MARHRARATSGLHAIAREPAMPTLTLNVNGNDHAVTVNDRACRCCGSFGT